MANDSMKHEPAGAVSATRLARPRRRTGWMGAVSALSVTASLLASGPTASFAATPATTTELRGVSGDPAKPDAAPLVKAEIVVLHATNEGKGIDPGIGKMPELLKPPFSSYDTYKLIEKSDLELPKGTSKDKTLPDGGKLSVALKDIVTSKTKGEPTRFLLSASIDKADGKTFLPGLQVNAVQGEYFFIAGQKFRGGIMVIGVRIR